MWAQYGCFPSGGLLIGDGSSFQRIDGEGRVVWSIHGLDQRDIFFLNLLLPEDDTMVLSTDGALVEVTVHSEPQFDRVAATYLVLTLVVVGAVVLVLYLGLRKRDDSE
jgi:hypothetical protein